MEKNPGYKQNERYHVVTIQSYLALGDFEGSEKTIDDAIELFPESILLKVCIIDNCTTLEANNSYVESWGTTFLLD